MCWSIEHISSLIEVEKGLLSSNQTGKIFMF
jgi:hypothetical protein